MNITIDQCYNRALDKALYANLKVTMLDNPYLWAVASQGKPGTFHQVHLGHDGTLEGAKCECAAASHVTCIHRATALINLVNWLGTPNGVRWFVNRVLCAECGERTGNIPASEHTDLCGYCINIKQDYLDVFGGAA